MYTENLKPRIVVAPIKREFFPKGGWYQHGDAWHRTYACGDKMYVRRAVVTHTPGGWLFAVSEFTPRGVISVARRAAQNPLNNVATCWHAADLAACAMYAQEKVSVSASSVNECQ